MASSNLVLLGELGPLCVFSISSFRSACARHGYRGEQVLVGKGQVIPGGVCGCSKHSLMCGEFESGVARGIGATLCFCVFIIWVVFCTKCAVMCHITAR